MAIRTDYDTMMGKHRIVVEQHAAMERLISTMDSLTRDLPSIWEGESSTSFCNFYAENRRVLEAMRDNLDTMGKQMKTVTEGLKNVDQGGKIG